MFRKMWIVVSVAFSLILFVAGNEACAVGALAIDSNKGKKYGFSYDYPSVQQAEQRALQECGNGCQVVLRFHEGCGAYAADQSRGSHVYGWAKASSGVAAQNRALSECQGRGGAACVVRTWACNSQ